MAQVVFTRTARRQLSALDLRINEAVVDAITLLESDPDCGHALRGRLTGLRVLRIGVYRVIHELQDRGRTVRVVAVVHRSAAYRHDPR
jgi:mRNA interferase RelE/StbE